MLYTRVARSSFPNKQDYTIEIYHQSKCEGIHLVNLESGPDGDLNLSPDEADIMIGSLIEASNRTRGLMHPNTPLTQLLMSGTKPNGCKLEELINTVISDLVIKTESMKPGTENRIAIAYNNRRIIELLTQAKFIQDETMKL